MSPAQLAAAVGWEGKWWHGAAAAGSVPPVPPVPRAPRSARNVHERARPRARSLQGVSQGGDTFSLRSFLYFLIKTHPAAPLGPAALPPPVPSPPWSRELCGMGLRSRVLPGHGGGAADTAPLVPGPLGRLRAPRGRLAAASWAAARPLGLLPADVALAGLGWCGKASGFPRGIGCPAGSSAPPRGRSAFHRAAGWRIAPSSFLWLPGSPRLPCLL